MVNEYNAGRTAVELVIDHLIGGHTDANIATWLTSQDFNVNDIQMISSLLIQMLDRIETLEAP